jgi:hypothetical protein
MSANKKNQKDYLLEYLLTTSSRKKATRRFLCRKFSIGDRGLRNRIEHYRSLGCPIICFPDGKGYYLARSKSEFNEWLKCYTYYAKTIMKNAEAMQQTIENDMTS